MKTMQQEWAVYRDAVYPEGVSAAQNRETHQAFFSGALAVLANLNEIQKLPEDEAVAELAKLTQEVLARAESIVTNHKKRN